MRLASVAILAALALALTGCDKPETWAEHDLRIGIQCRDAGGEWVFIPNTGTNKNGKQFCQFHTPETETP